MSQAAAPPPPPAPRPGAAPAAASSERPERSAGSSPADLLVRHSSQRRGRRGYSLKSAGWGNRASNAALQQNTSGLKSIWPALKARALRRPQSTALALAPTRLPPRCLQEDPSTPRSGCALLFQSSAGVVRLLPRPGHVAWLRAAGHFLRPSPCPPLRPVMSEPESKAEEASPAPSSEAPPPSSTPPAPPALREDQIHNAVAFLSHPKVCEPAVPPPARPTLLPVKTLDPHGQPAAAVLPASATSCIPRTSSCMLSAPTLPEVPSGPSASSSSSAGPLQRRALQALLPRA